MFITKLEKNYLPLVAELEAKSYSEEFRLGLECIWKDIENQNYLCLSKVAFINGELVGYILAYEVDICSKVREIYISDLNCPNTRCLKRLLLRFFVFAKGMSCKDTIYEAHFRENSYHLLCNQQKKKNGSIQIIEDSYIPEYYDNGEAAHHVKFKVEVDCYLRDSWKDSFLNSLDEYYLNDNSNIMKYSIPYLKNWVEQVDFFNKKNMNFVIRNLKESIMDYYKMYDDKIESWFNCYFYVRNTMDNKTGFENTIKELERRGYEAGGADKGYRYDEWSRKLCISKKVIVYNTKYRDSLSGYRWLRNKELQYIHKTGRDAWIIYLNKYGVNHNMMTVPYLTERNYLYHLNKLIMKNHILSRLRVNDYVFSCTLDSFEPFFNRIYNLLRSKDAQKCINSVTERMKPSAINYFHDWSLIVDNLFEAKSILTDGAIISILCESYNRALHIVKNIIAIKQNLLEDNRVIKLFDLKDVRKKISKLIRNREDCASYIRELNEYLSHYYSSRLQISLAEKQKIPEYMGRIQKYNLNATIYALYRLFGRECLSGFLKGSYPSLFKPKVLYPSYSILADFVMGVLHKGSAQARHVYNKLKKGGLLTAIDTGCITSVQYEAILRILKKHNVKIEDDVIIKLRDFKICIEPKGSPEYLIAGDASVCCMSLGTKKAIVYAKEKGFGVINVYYRERIIANSVIWINKPYQSLVLDNIEVHPNYLKFRELLKISFYTVAEYLMLLHELRFVVQGAGYNDLELYRRDAPMYHFEKMEPVEVCTENFYTDALHFKIVMKKSQDVNPEELIQLDEDVVAA